MAKEEGVVALARCAHCGDQITLIDGVWTHRPGCRSPHTAEPADFPAPHNRKDTTEMTFEQAVDNAARTLDAAENEASSDRAGTLLAAANTWTRIAELINHRDLNASANKPA